MSSSSPKEEEFMRNLERALEGKGELYIIEECSKCSGLRKDLENAIKEEDRLVTALAKERRYHDKKSASSSKQTPQVD